MDVLNNPSQLLAEKLCKEACNHTNIFDEKCSIAHKQILEVKVDSVKEEIKSCHSLIKEYCAALPGETLHLLIHCGVNCSSNNVHLEKISKNFINDGVCYLNQIICEKTCVPHLQCKLDLDFIGENLKSNGVRCVVSEDAGTYLCNYVYFLSNREFLNNPDVHSVFFHIPDVNNMSIDQSHEVLVNFINEVKRLYLA